jgi:hypothetical protein
MVQAVFNRLEPEDTKQDAPSLDFDDNVYRRRDRSPRREGIGTRFGTIALERIRYEPCDGDFGLPSLFPLEMRLGIVSGKATLALADRLGQWTAQHTQETVHIEVNRRKRRAKSDRLDAAKLVTMLLRYHAGEHKVWSVVRVPEPADEERRQLHREIIAIQDERAEHVNRIKGFLASQGIALAAVTKDFPAVLAGLRSRDGSPIGADLNAPVGA